MRLLAPLLLCLAASCGGLTTKLCGAPGQPCCAMSTCDVGASCGSAQLCVACGGEGQPCCAAAACTEPLACVSGACVQGVTCAVQCTLGASRCASGGVETCRAAGVCPAWQQTVVVCPPGADCVASGETADCVERCPGACTPSTQLCTLDGLQACVESGACPTLAAQPDDVDVPACLTGAVVTSEFVWESPTPLGADLVDIAGELTSSYWVLDGLGNIVRYALGPWVYEVRATPGRRMRALASCGLGSRLYAVGEAGTVLRRVGGEWTEESVGSTTALADVACDSNRAYAVGANGQLYVRDGATWAGYPTGATSGLTGVAIMFSQEEVYLSGRAGLVVRCSVGTLPPTCVPENTGTAQDLTAIWGDTVSNTVFAVGEGGTFLQRGGSWSVIPFPGVTEHLTGVTGFYDAVNALTYSVAVSEAGRVIVRRNATLQSLVQLPAGTSLFNAWVPDVGTLVVTGNNGGLWYRGGVGSSSPFAARGGRKPVSADLLAVTSLGQGRLFAVGDKGARVRRQNGAWLTDELGASTTAALNGVAARSAGEVYAVGDRGTVMVRRWGTWGFEAIGLTAETLEAVALDATRVWALGHSSLLEKDLLSGAWRVIPLPQGTPITQALALRKDAQGRAIELIIAGLGCSVLRYTPADGQFTPVAAPLSCQGVHDLRAAAFLSSGDLVVASSFGGVFRRVGDALTAEPVSGLDSLSFEGLVPDGASMWAVGEAGTVFRRVSSTWVDALPDVTRVVLYAGVKDEEGLFFVGSGGTVLRRQ